VLFSGKIEFEHGINVFVDALKGVCSEIGADKFEVDICGGGPREQWLRDALLAFDSASIRYHGFVSDEDYKKLLTSSDVCVALQDPKGRFASMKSPSKVFEYLGYGKAVISTAVGDIGSIPREAITLCQPLEAGALKQELIELISDRSRLSNQSQRALLYAKSFLSVESVAGKIRTLINSELRSH
jgi:glycosyltransferase involved in cell wall biosynthesis